MKTECVRNGLTLENLVTKIGVNSATLHRKLSGETEFRCNKLQIIQTTLKLNDEQFLSVFLQQTCINASERRWRVWKIKTRREQTLRVIDLYRVSSPL